MRLVKHLLLIFPCLFFAACPRPKAVGEVSDTEIGSNLFVRFPEPGEVIFHPPVPVFSPPEPGEPNLLSNPDFESGLAYWQATGSSKGQSAGFDGFSAAGGICCHALSSAHGDVFVHQVVDVMPSTFYSFSALVFAPGDSEAFAEVRSEDGRAQLAGKAIRGPASAWTKVSLTFVTGRETEKVAVGVSCRNGPERTPVWIDQTRLRALPGDNLFSHAAAAALPDEDDEEQALPQWFINGGTAVPVTPGYKSSHSFCLPAPGSRPSRLYGLIYDYEQHAGQRVWITAITRIAENGGSPPHDAALNAYLTDTAGERTVLASAHPVGSYWSEISFIAEMPSSEDGASSVRRPFHALVLELEQGGSSILVDKICIFPLPDGFAGGLSAAHGGA